MCVCVCVRERKGGAGLSRAPFEGTAPRPKKDGIERLSKQLPLSQHLAVVRYETVSTSSTYAQQR